MNLRVGWQIQDKWKKRTMGCSAKIGESKNGKGGSGNFKEADLT